MHDVYEVSGCHSTDSLQWAWNVFGVSKVLCRVILTPRKQNLSSSLPLECWKTNRFAIFLKGATTSHPWKASLNVGACCLPWKKILDRPKAIASETVNRERRNLETLFMYGRLACFPIQKHRTSLCLAVNVVLYEIFGVSCGFLTQLHRCMILTYIHYFIYLLEILPIPWGIITGRAKTMIK